jgi:hypothetical protein
VNPARGTARMLFLLGGSMDLPKKKIVLKVKSSAAKEKFERRLAERKKTRKPTKDELLALEGRRFYSFTWPIGIISKLCEGTEIKANDYVLDLIEKEIARKEAL